LVFNAFYLDIKQSHGIVAAMFGSSIYEFLFILALVLVAIDFFIASDVLSLVAYLLFSYLVVHFADLPLMYGVLLGIGAWFVIVFLHYTVFKKVIAQFCNRVVAPSVIEDDPLARYVGKKTAVVDVDGRKMLRMEGDLLSFKSSENFNDGDEVKVTSFKEGIIEVVKQ
jgi:membrane protein implicated in regulation of membrane protease activity